MNKTKWTEWIRQLKLDVRVDVVLAELVEAGRSLDDIIVVPNSLFNRSFHRDIESAEEITDAPAQKQKMQILINRDGLYDLLPEDLFHQPAASGRTHEGEESVGEIKHQAEIEKATRLFFLPFEQEFYRERVMLEQGVKDFLFETNGPISAELLDELWHFPAFLDARQKTSLGILMPVLNQLAGDWEQVAAVLENITGDQVSIRRTPPTEDALRTETGWENVRVGVDTLLSGLILETQPSITVTIRLPGPEQLMEYMPGGRQMQIFEFLAGFLAPIETDLNYELDFAAGLPFALEEALAYSGRLNYTTII